MKEIRTDDIVELRLSNDGGSDEDDVSRIVVLDRVDTTISCTQAQYPLLSWNDACSIATDTGVTFTTNADDALRMAVSEHSSDGTTECCEEGTAHFCQDGSLVVRCDVGCSNEVYLLVEHGTDAVEACEIAIRAMEKMKERLSVMQEKVFSLSLAQNGCEKEGNEDKEV